ncbi:hypothetical protein AN958_00314 [Leucoagaricus sp. SymC.cos]|nr:hypothetical protein AN958_00314 [Leucoagaricus sp. SymC.cos]
MTTNCPECGGATTWDDSVGSAVCISCGTLTDPSQSVLTSQYDFPEASTRYGSTWDISSTKRARSCNWTLADQGKEIRDKRNSAAVLEFIESLARTLNASGLSPRTMNLFRQAKEAIRFRWGRKAKLIAGVCMAIALRESNRPDCLRDISYLLEEPFPALSRVFISVTSALKLNLNSTETSSYISILHQHTSSLLQDSTSLLSASLVQELSSISLLAASNTASSLSNILARIGEPVVIQGPTPPIACAIFVLSLESELRSNIKQLAPLAQIIGARLNVGKGAVMSCYKAIQDALASLTENVPWLDKYESKNGRAKLAKRNVVARATKDIVAFYNDTWRELEKPTLDIICENDTPQNQEASSDEEQTVPHKKRKTHHRVAMQFLLDPARTPLPNSARSSSLDIDTSTPLQSIHPLLTYYLSYSTSRRPTRLQLLAVARGGADQISDSELFEENEMENLMRNEEEMKVIAHMSDWGEEGGTQPITDTLVSSVPPTSSKSKRVKRNNSKAEERPSRINLDALARFLNDDDTHDDQTGLDGLLDAGYDSSGSWEPETEIDSPPPHETRPPPVTSIDEVIIEGWRPISPGRGTIIDDRYDEVYD